MKDTKRPCNLNLTDSTIEKMDYLSKKLDCSSRSELVRYVIKELYKTEKGENLEHGKAEDKHSTNDS